MAFQKQKDSILKFYDNTNELIKQHYEIYDKLVKNLNKKESISNKLGDNLDDFTENAFPEFNTFRDKIQNSDLNNDIINHVFDINKKEYIPGFELPNKKIIIKQSFNLVKVGKSDNILYNSSGTPVRKDNLKTFDTSFKFKNRINKNTTLECDKNLKLKTGCDCVNFYNCCHTNTTNAYKQQLSKILSGWVYEEIENIKLEFWIDDYFNIYIPIMETYLVFNYSKFPLYAFYNNMDKMNLYHNFIENNVRTIYYNEFCEEDLKEYNSIKSFIVEITSYLSSIDKRNEFKHLFCKLLDFYKYYEKNTFFSQYKTLSEKLELLIPSKSIKNLEESNEDTMNDEKKIFSQSVRIKELEIENNKQFQELEYLRNERKTFIENKEDLNSKLSSYEKLIEELNKQLHDKIDKISLQQKEIIGLKSKNVENTEIVNKSRRLEDKIKILENKILEYSSDINKYKTLNNTLIDKQTEFNQKLLKERNDNKKDKENIKELNIKLETNRVKIIELETQINKEQETNKLNKTKLEEILSNVSKTHNSSDNTYQELLLEQIKDKNIEIENLKKVITKKEKDNNDIVKQLNTLKSTLSGLVN